MAWVGTLEGVRLDSEPRTSRERRGDGAQGAAGDNLVSLDFDNVDLKVFIKYVSEITGRNYVVDYKVRGRITLISPTKIRVDELERVLESLLELNGFTAVHWGRGTARAFAVQLLARRLRVRELPALVLGEGGLHRPLDTALFVRGLPAGCRAVPPAGGPPAPGPRGGPPPGGCYEASAGARI
jgi:hypothetical protein